MKIGVSELVFYFILVILSFIACVFVLNVTEILIYMLIYITGVAVILLVWINIIRRSKDE